MPEKREGRDSINVERDQFASTRWSVVLAAGGRSSGESRQALPSLCESYWFPLYTYIRRRVADTDEAQDLTQAFFAEFLEKDYVVAAVPERGRFRAFLLTVLKHFLSKQWQKARAQKRGGGRSPIPLNFDAADARCSLEPMGGMTAEQLYDRQWAVTLLDQTMRRLETECAQAGKTQQFERLKGFLVGDHPGTTYAAVAEQLEMTEGAAKMAAHRLRVRYRELLRDEIAAMVPSPDEVENTENGRRVALKVLNHKLQTPEHRQRFLREGRLAASINHPNTVYIYGTEEIEGTPVIAMELAGGGTLQERVKRDGPFPVGAAVDVILDVIAGLAAAHAAGVLHRDVKPSNCFLDKDGVVKIGDFGLSISTSLRGDTNLTQTGVFLGTPAFSSPEQLRGDELDVRSDIYSVGVTLYYLLTGKPPFEAQQIV